MTAALSLALSAVLIAGGCRQEQHPMSLLERLRGDYQSRREPKTTAQPSLDGITFQGVIAWTRPAQNEGVPLTAYYSAAENRYWVRQSAGGLGGQEIWFGPFDLR